MELTQRYARPSGASLQPDGMRLEVSAEQSRPAVHLEALVKESLAYARLMLALYEVVTGDFRAKPQDHTAYQEWVQQRYMEEVGDELAARRTQVPALTERRKALAGRVREMQKQAHKLEETAGGVVFHRQMRHYFRWLYEHDYEAWYVLDPVVSVHPDGLIFEVFSQDESSYGRVTVPTSALDIFGDVRYGTTNIDYSRALADEISRIRSYRPAFVQIGAEGVTVATSAGESVEKKIDLPPTWVRGFLQVQSASAFGAVDLTLSAATVAEALCVLRRRKETHGPRSLRFVLAPNTKPSLVIEPWEITIAEPEHVYTGAYRGEIRIWGRRRLLTLESLLPYAERVQVRLMGSGMPSYWTVFQQSQRFDLGLSGWTKNDWAQAARFDLLAAPAEAKPELIEAASKLLSDHLHQTPEQAAAQLGVSRDAATNALQQCCKRGQAMYDHVTGAYRWRPLLPVPIDLTATEQDKRLAHARRLVDAKAVQWIDADQSGNAPDETQDRVRCTAQVRNDVRDNRQMEVVLDVDSDGRVSYAQCTCGFFRREKLRKGPCAHILAAGILAAEQAARQIAARAQRPTNTVDPNRFAGKTFVFTGTLSLFTRDQAEDLVRQAGGTAAGSVSRNTTYVVAGDKAGSKLAKARQLGIPTLTEAEFKAMLEGRQ